MDILKSSRTHARLGIVTNSPKKPKKIPKELKKRGKKMDIQRISTLGTRIVELGQYSHLMEFFPSNPTINQ